MKLAEKVANPFDLKSLIINLTKVTDKNKQTQTKHKKAGPRSLAYAALKILTFCGFIPSYVSKCIDSGNFL